MLLPGRNGQEPNTDANYRYGFQGQEMDDEVEKGHGNSINYKYRTHDVRVGRFLSLDPLSAKYPHYSPYGFSGNHVINSVELEGLEDVHVYNKVGDGKPVYARTYHDKHLMLDVNRVDHYVHGDLQSVTYKDKKGNRIISFSKKSHYSANLVNSRAWNQFLSGSKMERVDGKILPRFSQQSNSATEGFLDGLGNSLLDKFESKAFPTYNIPTRAELLEGMGIGILDGLTFGGVSGVKSDFYAAMGDNYASGYVKGEALPDQVVNAVTTGFSFGAGGTGANLSFSPAKHLPSSFKNAYIGFRMNLRVSRTSFTVPKSPNFIGRSFVPENFSGVALQSHPINPNMNFLRTMEPGNWAKVFEAGYWNGTPMEAHYFINKNTGSILDWKIKYQQWSRSNFGRKAGDNKITLGL